MMKFLRTAPTRQLLALIGATVAVIIAGTAIAIAATSGGPVPKPASLATAIRTGLSAHRFDGISADITFTNSLIDASDFQSDATDPLLQGASGRMWYSPASGRLRLELQSSNGDAQIVLHGNSFWVSDPSSQTVYEGTLPRSATSSSRASAGPHSVPSTASITGELSKLARRLVLNGRTAAPFAAEPTDVGGRPAYSVRITPRGHSGEVGGLALAWDAVRGVPLSVAVYATGNSSPVISLRATNISFGAVPASDFAVSPPSGDKVVRFAFPAGAQGATAHSAPSGLAAVTKAVPFTLHAPASAAGLPRSTVAEITVGSHPAALVTYGHGLSGIAVIETAAEHGPASGSGSSSAGGSSSGGLSLPTATIDGTSAQLLPTALGTAVTFRLGGTAYTIVGSVPPATARAAAAAVAAGA